MAKRALIFYISRFSGHYHAARAISKGLLKLDPEAEIRKINTFEYTNPILGRLINKAYMEVIKKKPEIWGNMYDNPDVLEKIKKVRARLHKFNMAKIKKLMEGFSPDVAICTQAFPCGMVADYKRLTGRDIPLIGVLTDNAPHSYWLFDEVDYYVVPSEETGKILAEKGVPLRRIKVYGIPVDPKFEKTHDVPRIRENIGFNRKDPVILIMGGNQGLGAMEAVVSALVKDRSHRYQIIVVTGSNKRLFFRLGRIAANAPGHNILILPYVDNIDELMEASDIIVTKAGGMTTAEALAKGLPLLLLDAIPGQERMNADYLVKKGVAVEMKNIELAHEEINRLFDGKGVLEDMRSRIREIARPHSAMDVAELAFTPKNNVQKEK